MIYLLSQQGSPRRHNAGVTVPTNQRAPGEISGWEIRKSSVLHVYKNLKNQVHLFFHERLTYWIGCPIIVNV